jgi:3D (Asp-Asp-Asp) domain-containing protein
MNTKLEVFKKAAATGFLVVTALTSLPFSANAGTLDLFKSASTAIDDSTAQTATINPTMVSNNFLVAINSPVRTNLVSLTSKIKFRELLVPITAYSSTVDQCDDSPFITANGSTVHDGIIATNFLPFGTKIKIPGYFGDKIFTVEDRMNKRYWQKIDVWFPDRQSAKEFGVRTLKVQIIES